MVMAWKSLTSLKKNKRRRIKEENSEVLADLTISKRGSLALPKALVEELGFQVDDTFVVRKTKAGFILKPV